MYLQKQFSNKKRLLTFLLIFLYTCIITLNVSAISTCRDNESLGLPKVNNESIKIIHHKAYTVGYDTVEMIPLWVQWHIDKSDFGNIPRKKFTSDPQISIEKQAYWYEYKFSGFDQGHICPRGDRNVNQQLMNETFYMTNAVPQNHQLNEGIWKSLEEELRKALIDKPLCEAFIISGTYGTGGWNNMDNSKYPKAHPINKYNYLSELNEFADNLPEGNDRVIRRQVAIPEYLWKCIIIVPNGDEDACLRINAENTVTISVWIPNKAIISTKQKSPWNDKEYLRSITQIEKTIGYELFPNLTNTNDIYEIKNRVFSKNNIKEAINQIR